MALSEKNLAQLQVVLSKAFLIHNAIDIAYLFALSEPDLISFINDHYLSLENSGFGSQDLRRKKQSALDKVARLDALLNKVEEAPKKGEIK